MLLLLQGWGEPADVSDVIVGEGDEVFASKRPTIFADVRGDIRASKRPVIEA